MIIRLLVFLVIALNVTLAHAGEPATQEVRPYTPTAENMASREWFQEARFGIFIHWGVYSELAKGEWIMNQGKMTTEEYKEVASGFNPTKYDPQAWVALFKQSGAKYITITSKHHDGLAMWDSEETEWDVVDATPYNKDVLKPLAEECKKQGLRLFFYHSQLDWTHPDYYPRGRTGRDSGRPDEGDFQRYLDFMDSQLTELLGGEYGDVAGIWFDGWWDQKKPSGEKEAGTGRPATQVDWRLRQTYDLIHRLQPACLVGSNHHVAPFPGEDFQMFERDLPGQNTAGYSDGVKVGVLPLETCDTINGSWGYNANDKSIKSEKALIHYLVRAAGQNANFLLNVGPKPDGTIQKGFAERLQAMGRWLEKYGETIYGTTAGPVRPEAWGVSTAKENLVYLHVLDCPEADADGWIELTGTSELKGFTFRLFDSEEGLEHRFTGEGSLCFRSTQNLPDEMDRIIVASPSR